FVALLLALTVVVAAGYDIRPAIQRALEALRTAGPAAFFLAMALLPAAGAPLSFFCLTAGPAFGPQLGIGWVLALALTAIAGNIALTFVLARHVLRPPLELLMRRLGYRLPQTDAQGATPLIVLMRVTPGVP